MHALDPANKDDYPCPSDALRLNEGSRVNADLKSIRLDTQVDVADYRDKKRYAWLLTPVWVLMPALSVYLACITGNAAYYWLTPVLLYFAMPLLDVVTGSDLNNPPESAVQKLDEDHYYKYILYVTVACHYLTLFVGAWAAGTQNLDWVAYAGLALSVGIMNGFAVATAHELGHKKSAVERWLAKICLATGAYGQYMIDHNRGHHKEVATPEDSGSARFGENFYQFAMRQLPHSTILRPWRLEKERLARARKGPWTLTNEFLQPALISLMIYSALLVTYGLVLIPFLLSVAAIAYLFLTLADFIEHYGLLRQKTPDGRYERVRPEHSWNTNHIASNIIFFHVQRHSDHHAWPTRRYQSLRNFDRLPTLPSGYPGMFGIALIPALWRTVMYPRVLAVYGGDVTKVNIEPTQREEMLYRYAPHTETPACEPTSITENFSRTPGTTAAALTTTRYECPGCGYTYDERVGDARQGFPAGTPWAQIPVQWSCPDCAVRDKPDFKRVES